MQYIPQFWVFILVIVGEPVQMQQFSSKTTCEMVKGMLVTEFKQSNRQVSIAKCVRG